MRNLFFRLAILTGLLASVATADAKTKCGDGTYSDAKGSGACSHHGGEAANHEKK